MSECLGGCCPHDSLVLSVGCPGDLPLAPLRERVAHLRVCQLLPVYKIVAATGSDRETISRLLFEIAAEASPGGLGWRTMMRRAAEDDWLEQVMPDTPWQARTAGPPPSRGPSEIDLLTAAVLRAKDIRLRPVGERSPFMRRWRQRER